MFKELFGLQALETQEAQFAGATKHVVELYDTCSSIQDVHFSRELVWTKVATTEDEKVTVRFTPACHSTTVDISLFYTVALG